MAILNRQPKKPETLIQIERERAAVLLRIREVWRRLFGIDIDAKNHLRNNTRPTPLVDAILAEIKTEKKPDEVKTKKRTRLPPSPESKDPGVVTGDVFRIFGNSARTIL